MSVNVVWMCEGYGEFASFFLVFLCLFAGFSRDCCWFLANFSLWHCHSGSYLNRAFTWQLNRAFTWQLNRAFTWQLNRAFSSQLNRAFSYNNNLPLIYITNLRDNSAQPLGAWASRPRLAHKNIKAPGASLRRGQRDLYFLWKVISFALPAYVGCDRSVD